MVQFTWDSKSVHVPPKGLLSIHSPEHKGLPTPHCLPDKKHNHIFCFVLNLLNYASSNVSTNGQNYKAQSHFAHFFDIHPLCVFKCYLRFPTIEETQLHWLHLLDFYPLCVFKCTSVCHLEKRHIRIICICSTFLCCILSKVILIYIPEKKHRCIRYIYFTFLQYESSNDSSNHYHNCRHSCIVYICLTF